MSDTLSQTIAHTIRETIKNGTYLSGDRLVELTLSQELAVSQNTIRDALHILEQEGWVNKIPRRGVYIPTFTLSEAREIYALWQVVGSLALEWTMGNITEIERQRLRETMITAEKKANYNDWGRVGYALYHFHTAIAIHANAPRTELILSRIHNQARILENQRTQLSPLTTDEWEQRIEHYFDVIHAMDSQEPDRAQKYLRRVIQYESDLVLHYIE